MRGKVIPGALVLVVIGALLLGLSLLKPNKSPVTTPSPELSEQLVKACDIMSVSDAKLVLGDDIEPTDDGNAASASSNDIAVSRCAFIQKIAAAVTPANQKQASLLARTPRSEAGKQANRDVFSGPTRPSNVQELSGYGEKAFWNPVFGQLNILQKDVWYTVEVGTAVPSERNAEDAKKLADELL